MQMTFLRSTLLPAFWALTAVTNAHAQDNQANISLGSASLHDTHETLEAICKAQGNKTDSLERYCERDAAIRQDFSQSMRTCREAYSEALSASRAEYSKALSASRAEYGEALNVATTQSEKRTAYVAKKAADFDAYDVKKEVDFNAYDFNKQCNDRAIKNQSAQLTTAINTHLQGIEFVFSID